MKKFLSKVITEQARHIQENVRQSTKLCPLIPIQYLASQHSFSNEELKICTEGLLFGENNAQLPAPPLLMIDRILNIQSTGGMYDRGFAIAELEIDPSMWFFKHHFYGDPVMPGSFLIEAVWQLAGFHLAWSGYAGRGRVIDSGKTRFIEPVESLKQTLTVSVDVRKIICNGTAISITDGEIRRNSTLICKTKMMKLGLVTD